MTEHLHQSTDQRMVAKLTPAGDESDERDCILELELDGDEVWLHIDPRTPGVQTVALTPAQCWQLARSLARAATWTEAASSHSTWASTSAGHTRVSGI